MTRPQRWCIALPCACVGSLIMFGLVGLSALLVAHDLITQR